MPTPKRRPLFFLQQIMMFIGVLACIGFALWMLQDRTGMLGPVLEPLKAWLAEADSFMDQSTLIGISTGMIVLSLLVLFMPLFLRSTIKSQYLTSVRRGIVASGVFFLSQVFYSLVDKLGKSYLILSMAAVMLASFLLIEILARFMKEENEASFRTDMFASMAAGLVSSIILTLVQGLVK